ncbi:P-loop containing nucleoside triphosphate hydrolase protein, partial [Clohesyomyces aquaticus]
VFHVTVWAYDWNGSKLLRIPYKFEIDEFDGEKRINELPLYPVEFFVDEITDGSDTEGSAKSGLPALRKILKSRAESFRDYCKCTKGSQLFKYTGSALVFRSLTEEASASPMVTRIILGPEFSTTLDRRSTDCKVVNEEIIVDPSSFATHGSDNIYLGEIPKLKTKVPRSCKACDIPLRQTWMSEFPNVECGSKENMKCDHFLDGNDHFMLLPPRVLGFLLSRKEWAQFNVADIQDIEQNGAAADIEQQLALPEKLNVKRLQNMVKFHSAVVNAKEPASLRDAISGKGNGLVFLFHGSTGVGKTFLAEILAQSAKMPLYKAGISDIGTKPKEAERGLRHLFGLAQAWNAILLIDEADVFLDSRGSMGEGDLEKNAMVAVLLREVEYFSGILILTTNRVMTFDVAMLSRVHWPINFGFFNEGQEAKVWNIWRTKWKRQNEEVVNRSDGRLTHNDVDREVNRYDQWRSTLIDANATNSRLNGREIRNIFLGARTMAAGNLVEWDFIRACYSYTTRFRSEMHDRRIKTEGNLVAAG